MCESDLQHVFSITKLRHLEKIEEIVIQKTLIYTFLIFVVTAHSLTEQNGKQGKKCLL